MAVRVSLKGIVDALEGSFEEALSYLDPETGEIETVSREVLSHAEEDGDPDDLLDWQQDEFQLACRIVETGRFLRLPTEWDVHEWEIMDQFARSITDASVSNDLRGALHGRGAFRYFKDTLRRYQMEQTYYDYRSQALREIAIEWCEENGIAWS
jgi:hypothetical protein